MILLNQLILSLKEKRINTKVFLSITDAIKPYFGQYLVPDLNDSKHWTILLSYFQIDKKVAYQKFNLAIMLIFAQEKMSAL
jgi:hypothetical protein